MKKRTILAVVVLFSVVANKTRAADVFNGNQGLVASQAIEIPTSPNKAGFHMNPFKVGSEPDLQLPNPSCGSSERASMNPSLGASPFDPNPFHMSPGIHRKQNRISLQRSATPDKVQDEARRLADQVIDNPKALELLAAALLKTATFQQEVDKKVAEEIKQHKAQFGIDSSEEETFAIDLSA